MIYKYFIFLISVLFLNNNYCYSKHTLDFSIFVDGKFDYQKFMVFLDDGTGNSFIEVKFEKNIFTIKREIMAENATITIAYQSNDLKYRGVRLIVLANKKSFIKFLSTNENEENRLLIYKLKNGIDEVKSIEYFKIKKFCSNEVDSNIFYSQKYNELKNDSIQNIYNLSSIKLAVKQMDFLKKIKKINNYYIWFFNTNIATTLKKTHKKELLDFFNKYMPINYQNSEYGRFVKERLEANLYVKEGEKAPLFRVIGYHGDSIILERFKGKYVLIDFWATWCIPCIEKIPTIKKIRNDFDTNILEIVSISYDKDSIAFANGIKKYELNWLHIFNNPKIRNAYGDTPIPAMYLINPDGVICYSSWENNIDKIFDILKKQLK